MNKTLVGYTGFVGSNLDMQTDFCMKYNSKNIYEAFGKQHELVVYCGVRAEKFLANGNPDNDLKHVLQAIDNIKKLKPQKLVLVSTVDVYNQAEGVDEDTVIATDMLQPYGKHRYMLEQWVMENIDYYHIIRLPGLYGRGIKKNFIFDLINIIPSMLSQQRLLQLKENCPIDICKCYLEGENGFYRLKQLDSETTLTLKKFFEGNSFNAVSFTHSRSTFQFYSLNYLWHHIQIAIENNIKILCLATEPVCACELYKHIYGKEFVNLLPQNPACYDMHTRYYKLFGGERGYIASKQTIMDDIKNVIIGETK